MYDVGFQASAADDEVFLSIIMPIYNEGPTIRRAVRQVLSTSVLADQGKPDTGTISASCCITRRNLRSLR
jgi:hypothetical protein